MLFCSAADASVSKMESAAPFSLNEFSKLLKREDFLGIGEAYWTRAVEDDNRILAQSSPCTILEQVSRWPLFGRTGEAILRMLLQE